MPTKAELEALADQKAEKYGIPPTLFRALVTKESGWNPNIPGSSGEIGLTQLMPGTAAELGVRDRYDPDQNLEGGAKYLAQQYQRFGDWERALTAYNAGPAATGQGLAQGQAYAKSVLQIAGMPGGTGGTTPPQGGAGATITQAGGFLGLGGLFPNVTNFIWNLFLRIVVILVGLIIIWVGLSMLRNSTPAQDIRIIKEKIVTRRQAKAKAA